MLNMFEVSYSVVNKWAEGINHLKHLSTFYKTPPKTPPHTKVSQTTKFVKGTSMTEIGHTRLYSFLQ